MRITHHPFGSRIMLFLALLLTTAWVPAPQVDELAVVGQVTNGTPDGIVPADLPVALHVFSGLEEPEIYTTTLSSDGLFHFDLAPKGEETFMARVVYQDVVYVSDLVTVEPGQAELNLPVTVYETTEDPSAILVTQLHVFMTREGDRLQVGEYYLVSNTDNRTYIGAKDPETGRRVTLTITPPAGAEGMRLDNTGQEERYLERDGSFADTEPILPGTATTEALFSYDLPDREGFRVERAFDAPVASVVLVIPEEAGIALEGTELTSEGTMDTQMGPALSYTAGPLAAGEPLAFTMVAKPYAVPSAPTGTASVRDPAREIAIGLVTLAAAVMAIYLLWRSPAPRPLPAQARPLVEKIAALDADFEAGQVKEKTYRQKRKALKQRILRSL